jgi:hypothetical protein
MSEGDKMLGTPIVTAEEIKPGQFLFRFAHASSFRVQFDDLTSNLLAELELFQPPFRPKGFDEKKFMDAVNQMNSLHKLSALCGLILALAFPNTHTGEFIDEDGIFWDAAALKRKPS